MSRHLSAAELLDLAEGVADEPSRPHLVSCGDCRAQLEDVRAALALARVDEAPEPSPLFWDHLSARIHDAVAAERAAAGLPRALWASWRLAVPVGAAAAIVAVALTVLPRTSQEVPSNRPPGTGIETRAAVPDTPIADDASLSFVADLASDLDWDGAAQAGFTAGQGAIDGVLPTLSDTETAALQRILSDALAQAPSRGGV